MIWEEMATQPKKLRELANGYNGMQLLYIGNGLEFIQNWSLTAMVELRQKGLGRNEECVLVLQAASVTHSSCFLALCFSSLAFSILLDDHIKSMCFVLSIKGSETELFLLYGRFSVGFVLILIEVKLNYNVLISCREK